VSDSLTGDPSGPNPTAALPSARASARLGLTLRAVLLTPEVGFGSAIRSADRRRRSGKRPAEGMHPYVLAAAGGAGLLLLWLKVGGLMGLRDAPLGSFRIAYLVAAVALGAILGLGGQVLWSGLAAGASGVERDTAKRDLRIAWGAAALPQIGALLVLLPLDLAVAGPAAFATDPLGDSVSTAWLAFSIAVAGALAAWNFFLLAIGARVGLQVGRVRAAFVTAGGLLLLAVLIGPFVVYPAVTS
jgi:hypothetical protein